MQKIKEYLDQKVNFIICLFLLIQPILDVITSISLNVFRLSFTIGILVRFLFLCFIIYYLLFISRNRLYKFNFSYLVIELVYFISFFIIVITKKGYASLSYEMINTIKSFYFPTLLVGFINIVIDKKEAIDIKFIGKVFIIYLLLLVVPLLTHTSFYAYEEQIGSIGWFYASNEISGILSIMLPIIFFLIFQGHNWMIKIFSLLGILIIFFTISTKTPILAYFITLFFYSIYYLCLLWQQKMYKWIVFVVSLLIILFVSIILLIPKTPVYDSIQTRLNFFGIQDIKDIFRSKENMDIVIFSSRLKFLDATRQNYHRASIDQKILGIGYIENYGTDLVNSKMIEMDYFDIFYRHGIIGFIIYFLPAVYFLSLEIKEFVKKKKNRVNLVFLLSIFLTLLLALLTGHIFIAPAVSIWVVVIISNLYFRLKVVNK